MSHMLGAMYITLSSTVLFSGVFRISARTGRVAPYIGRPLGRIFWK